MSVHALVLHLLFLILAHQLSQCAVELAYILREQFPVSKNLKKQLLLILFLDKPTLNPESLVSNLLPAIVEYLLSPNSSLFFLFVALDFKIPLLECESAYLAIEVRVVNPTCLEKHLVIAHNLMRLIVILSLRNSCKDLGVL